MNEGEVLSLLKNPDVQMSLHGIFEKTLLEQISFIALSISCVISLIALIVVYIQLRNQVKDAKSNSNNIQSQPTLLRKEIVDDHERSRREVALDMLKLWVTTLRHESQSTRLFVEKLEYEQCKALYNYQQVTISESEKPLLLSCLQHSYPSITIEECLSDRRIIKPQYASHIRFVAMSYLNIWRLF
jgi:hypothetical protein